MRDAWAAHLGSSVLELLFPGSCLLCGRQLLGCAAPHFPVCRECLSALVPIQQPRRCRVCSMPLVSESGFCTRCRSREFAFDRCLALYEYGGRIRELLYQFKFQGRRRAARVLGGLMGPAYRERFAGLPAVPVPCSPRGRRRRGWDPMAEVAKVLRRSFGVEVQELLRRGASREQKALGFDERLANVRDAIRLKDPGASVPSELVLVDDILTTGATTSECARLLKGAGARRVEVLVFAID
ncbi:MAG: ComF family protein [Spirochaetales bacterium]|nr:ComF family protein [Spirochaetales bacterium]